MELNISKDGVALPASPYNTQPHQHQASPTPSLTQPHPASPTPGLTNTWSVTRPCQKIDSYKRPPVKMNNCQPHQRPASPVPGLSPGLANIKPH
eukprot:1143616-Pelagomonas_calceolata.AAC.3